MSLGPNLLELVASFTGLASKWSFRLRLPSGLVGIIPFVAERRGAYPRTPAVGEMAYDADQISPRSGCRIRPLLSRRATRQGSPRAPAAGRRTHPASLRRRPTDPTAETLRRWRVPAQRVFQSLGASPSNKCISRRGGTPRRRGRDCYAKTHLAVVGDRRFRDHAGQSRGRT